MFSPICDFFNRFFHVFLDIITIRNYRFHAFLRNCPPRRDLTVGYTSLYFVEDAHVLDLTVWRTSSLFDRHLEAFWGAADLSVVYAFPLLRHETNMCVKHQKTGFVYTVRIRGAHPDPPKGGPKKRITYDNLIFLSPNGRLPPDAWARRGFRLRTG